MLTADTNVWAGYGRLTRGSPPLKPWLASPFFEVPISGSSMWQTSSGKGVPEIGIREDFPALSDDDLAYAKLVARFGKILV